MLRDFRRLLAFTIAAALAGACGDHNDNASRQCQAAKADAALVARALPRDAAPAVAAADTAPAEPAPPPAAFDAQMRLMFRIAGCGGDDPLPAPIPTSVVQKHCQALDKIIAEYREHWLDKALPFLAGVVPKDIPDTILYPFGGSDLITALATFPDAREITIISLEHAGDVRVVDKLKPDELADSLKKNRDHLQFLYRAAFQKTADLKAMSRSNLPGHLVGSFVAFHILGYVPVTMRYFVLKEDGSLEYVTDKFSNVEITFRKPGGRLQTHRHIAANLADGPLRKNVGLVAYMEARAPFTAMTKASSFLLWENNFKVIRDLLLQHMVWMISDATGPLPEDASKAGFEQIPYGRFTGPEPAFADFVHADQGIKLYKDNPHRNLPIRYGYSDEKHRANLLITRKKGQASRP